MRLSAAGPSQKGNWCAQRDLNPRKPRSVVWCSIRAELWAPETQILTFGVRWGRL